MLLQRGAQGVVLGGTTTWPTGRPGCTGRARHPGRLEHLAGCRGQFNGRLCGLEASQKKMGSYGNSRSQMRVTCLRAGPISNYNKLAPMTAWSPLRSIQSLSKFFFISGTATLTAWYAHPHLLNLAAHVLNLDFKDNVTAFQTSFFSFLSLVFAIYSGNTMAFLYDRQKEVVKNLYAECMALEELLEESVNTLGPDARDILAQVRLYIDQEMYMPENQSPPLGEGHALAAIRAKARNYRRAGTDVGEILQASQRLAHAQSARQATACRLLPPVHWALLYTIGALFVSTFILFETGGSFSNEGRHILFTVLCGLMSFVLVALRDLADPHEGVYNATALLSERLSYINSMLSKYEKLPSRAPTVAATLGTSVPSNTIEDAAKASNGGLLGIIGAADQLVEDAADALSDKDSDDSSSDGSPSDSSALSQIGAALFGGNAASTDAAPLIPSGMGPATGSPTNSSGTNSSASSSSSERKQEAAAAAAPTQGSNGSSGGARQDLTLRSSIVEKPPSFKKSGSSVSSQALSGGGQRASGGRTLLRVKSLEEQVASLAKQSAPAYRWPGGAPNVSRPSANVR